MVCKEKFNSKLLVEGKDDFHVLCALFVLHNVPQTFDVIDCDGIDPLIEQIPVRLKVSNLERIGILLDADLDLNNRWIGLKDILRNQGYTPPENLDENGMILQSAGLPTFGIWLMPDNKVNGMIEDFIKTLVPEGDPLIEEVHTVLEKIEGEGKNRYNLNHKSKAIIHNWLAWQEAPGTPLGLAISKSYLTTNHALANRLIQWINNLFNS